MISKVSPKHDFIFCDIKNILTFTKFFIELIGFPQFIHVCLWDKNLPKLRFLGKCVWWCLPEIQLREMRIEAKLRLLSLPQIHLPEGRELIGAFTTVSTVKGLSYIFVAIAVTGKENNSAGGTVTSFGSPWTEYYKTRHTRNQEVSRSSQNLSKHFFWFLDLFFPE